MAKETFTSILDRARERARKALQLEKLLEHVDLAGLVNRLMLTNAEGKFAREALRRWFAAPPEEGATCAAGITEAIQSLVMASDDTDGLIAGPRETAASKLILEHVEQIDSGKWIERGYVQGALLSLIRMLDVPNIAELCDVTRSPLAIQSSESQVERLQSYVQKVAGQFETEKQQSDQLAEKEENDKWWRDNYGINANGAADVSDAPGSVI